MISKYFQRQSFRQRQERNTKERERILKRMVGQSFGQKSSIHSILRNSNQLKPNDLILLMMVEKINF
jgi:hypothetical protein